MRGTRRHRIAALSRRTQCRRLVASVPIKLPKVLQPHHFHMGIGETNCDTSRKLLASGKVSRRSPGASAEVPGNRATTHASTVQTYIPGEQVACGMAFGIRPQIRPHRVHKKRRLRRRGNGGVLEEIKAPV